MADCKQPPGGRYVFCEHAPTASLGRTFLSVSSADRDGRACRQESPPFRGSDAMPHDAAASTQRARTARRRHGSKRRDGVILIIVLVVLVLLSLSAYTFSALMVAERASSILSGRESQARALAESGVDYLRMYLVQDKATLLGLGGTYDNPAVFQGQVVTQDEEETGGRFTIMAPAMQMDGTYFGFRYGLEDESARVNLAVLQQIDEQLEGAGRDLLMALPGMTEDIADSILDWIDEDDEPREFGAELEYYSTLSPPYGPKNGPLESIEELLLVRGVTPQLLFGADVNRNGSIDSFEAGLSTSQEFAADATDIGSDRGWSAYLSMFSQEANLNSLNEPRIFVNGDDLELLYDELVAGLNEEWATFIVAYRQNGPYEPEDEEEEEEDQSEEVDGGRPDGGGQGGGQGGDGGGGGAGDQTEDDRTPQRYAGGQLDLTQEAQSNLTQLLDLVGAVVEVTFEGEEEAILLASPVDEESAALELPFLMDNLTTIDAATIPGRININQAPLTILLGIPGMTEEIANEIVSRRDVTGANEDPNRLYETWLLAEGIVTLEEMRQLAPFICGGGSVYRAQVVGYFPDSGASSRVEVVLDASAPIPSILFWRDISHLGRGFSLATLDAQAVP